MCARNGVVYDGVAPTLPGGEAPGNRAKKKCPRLPAAAITTRTAATGEVLTGLVGSRPADLGHPQDREAPGRGQRRYSPTRQAPSTCSTPVGPLDRPPPACTAIASKRYSSPARPWWATHHRATPSISRRL